MNGLRTIHSEKSVEKKNTERVRFSLGKKEETGRPWTPMRRRQFGSGRYSRESRSLQRRRHLMKIKQTGLKNGKAREAVKAPSGGRRTDAKSRNEPATHIRSCVPKEGDRQALEKKNKGEEQRARGVCGSKGKRRSSHCVSSDFGRYTGNRRGRGRQRKRPARKKEPGASSEPGRDDPGWGRGGRKNCGKELECGASR